MWALRHKPKPNLHYNQDQVAAICMVQLWMELLLPNLVATLPKSVLILKASGWPMHKEWSISFAETDSHATESYQNARPCRTAHLKGIVNFV